MIDYFIKGVMHILNSLSSPDGVGGFGPKLH